MKKQTDSKTPIHQTNIERATFKNLFVLVKKGQFVEIAKVIRRRTLNSLKAIKRMARKAWGVIYDYPPIKYWREQRKLNKILLEYFGYPTEQQNNNKTIQVALIIGEGKTAPKSSAFIRLISPLTEESIKSKISFKIFNGNTSDIGASFNYCIVQRTAFDSVAKAKQLVSNLNLTGTKLVIDTDDAFGMIDASHPEFSRHSGRMEAKNFLLIQASQIWVSTNILLKSLDPKLQKKAFVVPNGLDRRLWQKRVAQGKKKAKVSKLRMVYMGTATHDSDLKIILPSLEKLNEKYPGSFSLDLVGVTDDAPNQPWVNRVYLKSSLYPEFVEWFVSKSRFDIGLSPLVDSNFNRGKSDIKCLDYLAAGILPVVSNTEAYKSTDLDNYIIRVNNGVEAWCETLESLISETVLQAEINKKIKNGQKYIWSKRSSKNTANIIYQRLMTTKKSS